MKRKGLWIAIAIVLVVVIGVVMWQQQQPAERTEKSIKVGAVFTLTGPIAYWSEQVKKGMDLALEEIVNSEEKQITVIYEDVQGNAQKAVAALNKLINIDNVSISISIFTPISQPLREISEGSKVPLLATVTSAHKFARGYNWVFRDFPTQDQMAGTLAEYAKDKLNIISAAALVVNDDYGKDGARVFKRVFEKKGGVWKGEELFEQKATDVRHQATKIVALQPDAVLVVGRDQSLAIAIRQLRELGFKGRLLSVNCLDSKLVWDLAGKAVEDAIFASAFVDFEKSEEGKVFYQRFLSKYNSEPDYVTVYGYTIMKYLVTILLQTNGNRELVKNRLVSLDVESIRGRLIMNDDHDVISPIALYIIRDMKKKILEVP